MQFDASEELFENLEDYCERSLEHVVGGQGLTGAARYASEEEREKTVTILISKGHRSIELCGRKLQT